jgi:hypothetical protein
MGGFLYEYVNCLSETALVRMASLLSCLLTCGVLLRRCIARVVYITFCETNVALSYLSRIRTRPLSDSLPKGTLNVLEAAELAVLPHMLIFPSSALAAKCARVV